MAVTKGNGRPGVARNYPPLAVAGLAILALLAIFPSSLNLPQTNPSETLEYAPVPPEDADDITPPAGNFSSLGLGGTSTFGQGAGGAEDLGSGLGEAPGGRAIKTAGTKRCVGNPPRQTEDPFSPPCVASFTGDNGGATYQGVTGEEVRVLFAYNGGGRCVGCSRQSQEEKPVNTYFDLGKPPPDPETDEPVEVRNLRVWQRYFNERYQTYGRFVHFWAHFGPGAGTPESRRAQAAQNYEEIKPFAISAGSDDYVKFMANKGVFVFSDLSLLRAENYSKFAGLIWNYQPSTEKLVANFASHVCTKVAPHPVADSGNAGENGQPRVYGLIHLAGENDPEFEFFRNLLRKSLENCGIRFAAVGTYPLDRLAPGDPSYAPPVIADFRDKGVTTVIWAGGSEPSFSQAAKTVGYFPEWILAGTGGAEGNLNGQNQDPDVWDHAWVVTTSPLVEQSGVPKACEQAWAEGDGFPNTFERNAACVAGFNSIRQMFTGIQVAGPELNRENVDKGYHAIPPKNSPRPDLPACFYDLNDYTCVKDGTVMWWDSKAQSSSGTGCWRMSENGARYRPGSWPGGNLDAQRQPGNVCNNILVGAGVIA